MVTYSDRPADPRDWVFLTYHLPREPSAPRLALWRAIGRLGALQLSPGLIALPRTPRNLEHLQWLAAEIRDRAGTAGVWHARSDSARDHDRAMEAMVAQVSDEYRAILDECRALLDRRGPAATPSERRRASRRLRGRLRRIAARDYFGAPVGDAARIVVEQLAEPVERTAATTRGAPVEIAR